jgi:hypothetical protein
MLDVEATNGNLLRGLEPSRRRLRPPEAVFWVGLASPFQVQRPRFATMLSDDKNLVDTLG